MNAEHSFCRMFQIAPEDVQGLPDSRWVPSLEHIIIVHSAGSQSAETVYRLAPLTAPVYELAHTLEGRASIKYGLKRGPRRALRAGRRGNGPENTRRFAWIQDSMGGLHAPERASGTMATFQRADLW